MEESVIKCDVLYVICFLNCRSFLEERKEEKEEENIEAKRKGSTISMLIIILEYFQ